MKSTWFHHSGCTNEEANQLIISYTAKNIKTEKSLAADYKSWTVSALLPEYASEPVPSTKWQQPIWSRI